MSIPFFSVEALLFQLISCHWCTEKRACPHAQKSLRLYQLETKAKSLPWYHSTLPSANGHLFVHPTMHSRSNGEKPYTLNPVSPVSACLLKGDLPRLFLRSCTSRPLSARKFAAHVPVRAFQIVVFMIPLFENFVKEKF